MEIRHRIYDFCNSESPFIALGNVKLDESYFGARRVRGKRGGKVYTEIVPDCKSKTLQDIVRGKVSAESFIHTDGWRGYDGLVDIR